MKKIFKVYHIYGCDGRIFYVIGRFEQISTRSGSVLVTIGAVTFEVMFEIAICCHGKV